jgi:4-carboxymuconolactone decarboxylase
MTRARAIAPEGADMPDHLPRVYTDFRARFPDVARAQDRLAETLDAAGPLDDRTARLVKLGIAIGAQADGAVRSNVRKALAAGATSAEIEQVVVLSLTTRGFPALIAAWGWVREVLDSGEDDLLVPDGDDAGR